MLGTDVNYHGNKTVVYNAFFLGGTLLSAVMGPFVVYKFITSPSLVYERDPRFWKYIFHVCVGLSVGGAGVVLSATREAYAPEKAHPYV